MFAIKHMEGSFCGCGCAMKHMEDSLCKCAMKHMEGSFCRCIRKTCGRAVYLHYVGEDIQGGEDAYDALSLSLQVIFHKRAV